MIKVRESVGCVKKDAEFGSWTVLGSSFRRGARWVVVARCECGRIAVVGCRDIATGRSTQCIGCHMKYSNPRFSHGLAIGGVVEPLYSVWSMMRQRCENDRCKDYRWYGAKGISVCLAWQSYIAFREWALGHGYQKGLTIDRIKSNEGYCPENCRWITQSENASKANQEKRKT